MNLYEWLESPDVREYLESIHYEFTLPEAFYVIRENEQRALEVKIAAREELLDVMQDCPFSIEPDNIVEWKEELGAVPGWSFSMESDCIGRVETASFHMAVREFIGYQKGLLEEAFRKDGAGAYGAWDVKDGKEVPLSEYLAKNWQEMERAMDHNRRDCCSLLTTLGANQDRLEIFVNRKKQVTDISVLRRKEGRPGIGIFVGQPLQAYQPVLPIPFCRGDIVHEGDDDPMVLDYIAGWSEEELLRNGLSPRREDEKISVGYVLLILEGAYNNEIIRGDISVAPIRLQYYRKPLKGSERVLRAVSSYLKGDLELGQMCMAYHIFAKRWEARRLRNELIESLEQDNKGIDIARAAGLELNEGPEGEMDE